MAAMLAAGLLSNGYGLLAGAASAPRTHRQAQPDWSHWLDGRATADIADAIARTPLPAAAAKLERGAAWLAIGDLGPRVRQGCPGWLFLADELIPYPQASANMQARTREVAAVAARLRSQDIALLVATVPDKTRIAAARLCGLRRPSALEDRLRAWTASLRQAGIAAPDLEPALRALGSQAFRRTDSHWNQAGAEAAAGAIAAAIRQLPTPAAALEPRQPLAIVRGAPQPVHGDLVRLAGIDWLPARLLPPPDLEPRLRFDAAAAPSTPAQDADDLFGDAGLPRVALIGTSYSRNAEFVPFLEAALQARVASFALDGGEFAGAARAYFNGDAFRRTPPRLVVWEIPERALQRPLDGETGILASRQPSSEPIQ
ncbi:cell division protein FtsQ [Pigmentiphaga soli]|uniref:Cell division protein FtsQ n=1 Tax=Pigmentiphaga soli TaxID=1007095 RepID=A0ABP8GSQ5_9BURK